MKRTLFIALAAAVMLLARGATAAPHEEQIRKILPDVQSAVLNQDVIDSLRTYNKLRKELSQTAIDRMENNWQSEIGSTNQPLISSVVDNKLADRMRQVAEATGIEDIVVIDAKGLSIAQSTAGTGIWLGQEPAFARTVQSGPDALFIDEVDFHEPTQSYQARVSFTVADPDTGEPIGAITLGFNADAL